MSRTHGLAATYRDGGCRCEPCRKANTRACIAERERRRERLAADPSLAEHGTAATYTNWGCRCTACTAVNSVRCSAYKARRKAGAR